MYVQIKECSNGRLPMSLSFDLLFCNIYQSFSVMHIPSATIKIPPALRNPVMNEQYNDRTHVLNKPLFNVS